MDERFNVGDRVILSFQWTAPDVNGVLVPTDPTTASAWVKEPDGTIVDVTSTLTKISTGLYEGSFDATQSGTHWYRGEGTGTARAAAEKSFLVREQEVIHP